MIAIEIPITLDELLIEVATRHRLNVAVLWGTSRTAEAVRARRVFAVLAKQHGYTQAEIARILKRNHSTVFKYLN